MWSNSSSNWERSSVIFDVSAVPSNDRPNEYYVVGGYHDDRSRVSRQIHKLDARKENHSWIELDDVTIPSHLATTHMAVSIDKGRLFIFTGQPDYGCGPATRSSAYLDLSTKQWINLPDVREALYAPSVVIANNHVHLFGGAKPDGQTPSLGYWQLDLANLDRGWFSGPSMPQSGAHGHGFLIDGWIYSFGFEHGHSPVQATHKGKWDGKRQIRCLSEHRAQPGVFKIHSNAKNGNSSKWIRLSDIPHPVSQASSIVLSDRWILLVGGIGPSSHVQLFDTRLNRWRSLSPLPISMKNTLLWTNEEQSILYLQSCSSATTCLTYQASIIWSYQPQNEKCLFYTHLNCTTRQLQRTPFDEAGRLEASRWTRLFSQIYLLNMPTSVDRLRQSWSQLSRMGLTSITLFEAFRVDHIRRIPLLIQEELLWPEMLEQWRAKNETQKIRHYALSRVSLKLAFMNLWSRNSEKNPTLLENKPVLIMEDDLEFVQSKEATFDIVESALNFLRNHSEIQWDVLYLGYRSVEATRTYQVSENPSIYLWHASRVLSGTSYIVNQDRRTVERLNQCCFTRLTGFDQSMSFCVKFQFIRAYLIEPRLVQAMPGFSLVLNDYHDYHESRWKRHRLGNHTKPARFNSLVNI